MSDDPSTIGLQHPAFSVGKVALLEWINTTFGLGYAKVEECASGAVYCQILDAVYPGQVPMKTVKWNARSDVDWVSNFKIVQKVMTGNNIAKPVPIDKLVKGKYQDNLEFLQWFKHFFECRYGGQPYDAAERRALGVGGAASGMAKPGGGARPIATAKPAAAAPAKKPTPAAAPASTVKKTPAASPKAAETKTSTTTSASKGGGDEKEKLLAQIAELEAQMVGFEKERDFYFGKLREVEIYCQNSEGDEFTKEKVIEILYKTDEADADAGASAETTAAEPEAAAPAEETF